MINIVMHDLLETSSAIRTLLLQYYTDAVKYGKTQYQTIHSYLGVIYERGLASLRLRFQRLCESVRCKTFAPVLYPAVTEPQNGFKDYL